MEKSISSERKTSCEGYIRNESGVASFRHTDFRSHRWICHLSSNGYLVRVTQLHAPSWQDNAALFLDLDGTLLEFAHEPAAVVVPERVRQILPKLKSATGGAVAFISGRTLSELDRLLGAQKYPLAAVHGLERRDAEGRISRLPADRKALARMLTAVEEIADRFPNTLVERKEVAIALHYRQCPEVEQDLLKLVQLRLEPDLILLRGNMVLEMRPDGENKGTAIAAFMKEAPFTGRTPVFIGDDVTDEDGFLVVNELGGVSVKVGEGRTVAKFRLPDVAAVIDWLDEIPAKASA